MIPRRNLVRAFKMALRDPGYAISAASRRFRSWMSYRFFSGWSAWPETITLYVTYLCNLRCKMCGQWGECGYLHDYDKKVLEKGLDIEIAKKVIQDVKDFKPTITLFGGEPLMYKHLYELISLIKENGMRVNMVSNGTLLERHAEKLVELGLDEIIFSLDGPREIHDKIRGVKGTFDRAMAGHKKLKEIKRERGVEHPKINTTTAIFEINHRHLEEIVSLSEEIGAGSFTLHHLIFLSKENHRLHNETFQKFFNTGCEDWNGFVRDTLPDIDPGYLIETFHKLRQRKSPVAITFYPNYTDDEIREYYTNFDFVPASYRKRCMSPWNIAYIFPDGSVRPCLDLCFKAGNLHKAGFREIWNNIQYKKFRGILKGEKFFPACTRCTEFYRY